MVPHANCIYARLHLLLKKNQNLSLGLEQMLVSEHEMEATGPKVKKLRSDDRQCLLLIQPIAAVAWSHADRALVCNITEFLEVSQEKHL
jgi:hypothetical protein